MTHLNINATYISWANIIVEVAGSFFFRALVFIGFDISKTFSMAMNLWIILTSLPLLVYIMENCVVENRKNSKSEFRIKSQSQHVLRSFHFFVDVVVACFVGLFAGELSYIPIACRL